MLLPILDPVIPLPAVPCYHARSSFESWSRSGEHGFKHRSRSDTAVEGRGVGGDWCSGALAPKPLRMSAETSWPKQSLRGRA